jgi:hypothetical protein
VGGVALTAHSPTELPPMRMGEKAVVAAQKEGHVPNQVEVVANAATATVVKLVLEPARSVEVWSEPPGAKVFLDDKEVGTTPADLQIPAKRKFTLRLERTGFKTVKKPMKGDSMPKHTQIDLEPLPLNRLPLSAEEKKHLSNLDHELVKVHRDLGAAKAGLKKAEADLLKAQSTRHNFVADTTKVEDQVEHYKSKTEELEGRLEELNGEMDALRDEILSRFK